MKKVHFNSKYHKILTKKFLYREYIVNRKNIYQIAKIVGCVPQTIWNNLKHYNISTRTISKAKIKYSKVLTKDFLYKEYITNKKSITDISKEININIRTIWEYLKINNIKIRTIGETSQGKNNGNYKGDKAITKQIYYCKEKGCDNKIAYKTWKDGQARCCSCASKKLWKNKEYKQKTLKALFKARALSPNGSERIVIKLLNKILPSTYKFVGDGKLIIERFIPDFVNKNNTKIIEFFGDYWHNREDWKERDKRRLVAYKKAGYKTLIIWQHELKDMKELKEKVLEFNK